MTWENRQSSKERLSTVAGARSRRREPVTSGHVVGHEGKVDQRHCLAGRSSAPATPTATTARRAFAVLQQKGDRLLDRLCPGTSTPGAGACRKRRKHPASATIEAGQERQMVVAGQRRMGVAAARMESASGASSASTAAKRSSWLPSPRQASTVSRSSAIRASVCSTCWVWWRRKASRARACIRCIWRMNISAQIVKRPGDLALEQRGHQRQPLRLDHPGQDVGGQERASAAKWRTFAAGTSQKTAVPAPCSRSQSRWRRKSCMCRGVGRLGSVFTWSQAVRA